MIHRDDLGPRHWNSVHVTHKTRVAELIDIDNVGPDEKTLLAGFDMFRHAGNSLDQLIQEARAAGKRILPIGSGWAMSDINITDGWLVNTKLLNGCYDIADKYFETSYPAADRPMVVLAQGGAQIAEVNAYLEMISTTPRSLKASGIGNGQTIAGAVSGNTHGSQLTFGAMPDFVVGLHIATGGGRTLWIERASKPVLNADFCAGIDAELVRDDEIFNAAVVSFGTFGIIAAMALETDPIYHLKFPPITDIHLDDLKAKLTDFSHAAPADIYHFEFIINPHDRKQMAVAVAAPRLPFAPGYPTPKPRWILRDKHGYAPGVNILRVAGLFRFLPPSIPTGFIFREYRKLALLHDVRGSPGQLFTASIYYLEDYNETSFGVSVKDAPATIDICTAVMRDLRVPSIIQGRLVRRSQATLGFTQHEPMTTVLECGMINDDGFPRFERRMDAALRDAGIRFTMHWSKNSGIDPAKLDYMYGPAKIARWKAARRAVFQNDAELMKLFESDAMVRAGLD